MDVLKSYAYQVVSYHPEKARDDLFTEIYDELCEEFQDWQEMNPGKSAAILGVFVMLVFDIAHALFRLTRNFWSPRLRLTTIASNLLWIAVLGFVIAQPELLSIKGEPTDLPQDVLQIAKNAIRGVLGFVCALLAWDTVIHIWRMRR